MSMAISVVLFTIFAMAITTVCMLYSRHQTRKTIKHIQDLTETTINEIKQESIGLLNDISEKYLDKKPV